ncbi:hypothetical protein OG292_35995 [Streptomyces sp. NBC_01511]|uniref:hypothetical protein n=1 Tax=Streptomyces sp. NBC_01511 TaxID=2903889 RepID=UPI003870A99D
MSISGRAVIASAPAGTAAAGGVLGSSQAGAAPAPRGRAQAAPAASPPGDVVGRTSVGYQGWFACKGDGSPIDRWGNRRQDSGRPPSIGNNTIKTWPDMREYTRSFPTAYPNLRNAQPAVLFSSHDQRTADTHFRWMRENNCDTAALQRFNPVGGEGPMRDVYAKRNAKPVVRIRGFGFADDRRPFAPPEYLDVINWFKAQGCYVIGGVPTH